MTRKARARAQKRDGRRFYCGGKEKGEGRRGVGGWESEQSWSKVLKVKKSETEFEPIKGKLEADSLGVSL